MEDDELGTYARGMAGALRVIGPTPREQVHGMLIALHLLPHEREAVIAYGLATGILVAVRDDLRAGNVSGVIRAAG